MIKIGTYLYQKNSGRGTVYEVIWINTKNNSIFLRSLNDKSKGQLILSTVKEAVNDGMMGVVSHKSRRLAQLLYGK
jgi:hypothetical protein